MNSITGRQILSLKTSGRYFLLLNIIFLNRQPDELTNVCNKCPFPSTGMTITMVSPVLVDMFGIERIARCFALLSVFGAVAILLGIPLSGKDPVRFDFFLPFLAYKTHSQRRYLQIAKHLRVVDEEMKYSGIQMQRYVLFVRIDHAVLIKKQQ